MGRFTEDSIVLNFSKTLVGIPFRSLGIQGESEVINRWVVWGGWNKEAEPMTPVHFLNNE